MDDTTRGVGDESMRNYATEETTARSTDTPAGRPATRSRTRSAKSAGAAPSPDMSLDPDTERRTREIQAEIQHTREEMAETVEALQDRLRPSNVIADATDRVKTATSAKVKSMAETASDTAQDVMRETRERAYGVIEGARQNPIPALMIGAGVAWLLMDKSRNGETSRQRSWRDSRYGSSAYRNGSYYANETEPVYSDVDDNRTRDLRYDSDEGITARAQSAAEEGLDMARRTTYRAQNQLQRMLRENPLLVGAAAVVVGAAIGAALPETQRENELMGETKESVVNRAQDVARNAASTVQEVAKDAVGEAAQRVVAGGSSGSSDRSADNRNAGTGGTGNIGSTGGSGNFGNSGTGGVSGI
jgi:hypothetical protein